MLQIDITQLIPKALIQKALDVTVDFVVDLGEGHLSDDVLRKIRQLRSDGAFRYAFEEGMQRAADRFIKEYADEDEDLVEAIVEDGSFFENRDVQSALLAILKKPGANLAEESEIVAQSFDTILPNRRNRERVNRAILYFIKCIAEEVWHIPELRPVYELHFQRMTAEATRQQVTIQKAQLQELTNLNVGIREALFELTEAMAESRLLSTETSRLVPPVKPKPWHNLPQPDYGRFVGRDMELAKVIRILRPYPHSQEHLVTIDGIGGIGKSTLALEVAHRYLRGYESIPPQERFEAIIWASAKQTVLTAKGIASRHQFLRTLDDIYTTIAVTLQREDITRSGPEEQSEVVRSALMQQRSLLIIDNLETVDEEIVMDFLRELPAPTKAIVTTRHRIDVAYPVRLVGMSWDEAETLISQESDKRGVDIGMEEARRLYDRTGGVPLAMVWSIAQIGFGYGIEVVLHRLGMPNSDIAMYCFHGSLEYIRGKSSYTLLLALSLFATDSTRDALGYITGLPDLDRDDGLVDLEKLSLVNKVNDRYSLLPLTKSFTLGEAENCPEQVMDFYQRAIEYYLDLIQTKKEQRPRGSGYDYLELERANVLSLLNWCLVSDRGLELIEILDRFKHILFARGHWSDLEHYLEVGISICQEYDLVDYEMRFARSLGRNMYMQARYKQAEELLRHAAFLSESIDQFKSSAHAMSYLGLALISQDRCEEAKRLLQRKLEFARTVGDLKSISRLQIVLAQIDLIEGNPQEARMRLEEARDYRDVEGSESTALAVIYRLLGQVELQCGNPAAALSYFERSLAIAHQIKVATDIARAQSGLAEVYIELGQRDQALRHKDESVSLLRLLKMDNEATRLEQIFDNAG